MILEIELGSSFPTGQFLINGYSEPCRLAWNSQKDGIVFDMTEDILSELLGVEM